MRKICVLAFVFAMTFTKAQIITTIAGTGNSGYSGDGGQATSAKLQPISIAFDANGNIFIAESNNNVIRKINTSGIITTVAGNNTIGFSGDGGTATSAQLRSPEGIAFNSLGDMFIADRDNNRIRKVNTSGIITTVAGNGTSGFSGDGGSALSAQLSSPCYVSVDAADNLYISDKNNNRIRKVTGSGIITTVAGSVSQGYAGDGGQANVASLMLPAAIAVDLQDNLYIADDLNNVIRKVDASGIITTVAGNGFNSGSGSGGYAGDGGPATIAELNRPHGIAIDNAGNVFISDNQNQVIRMVNASGIIETVVGDGNQGSFGDGGPPLQAELSFPNGIAINSGCLYIVAYPRIRKVTDIVNGIENHGLDSQLSIYPNPANNSISISSSKNIDEIKITDVLGNECPLCPSDISPIGEKTSFDVSFLQNGIYFLSIISGTECTTRKFVVSH